MLTIHDTLAGDRIIFKYINSKEDYPQVKHFVNHMPTLGIDTESTGLNCYSHGWELRTLQISDAITSYVIPAERRSLIAWVMRQPVRWIGHNGCHDIRCVDAYLGYDTGVICDMETYIPSHHVDPRNAAEGGIGHGLKELAIHYVDNSAGKWEAALKKLFKTLRVPIDGHYKQGPKRGQRRTRAARLSEGWRLVDKQCPAYIAYAGSDPLLTYRLWYALEHIVNQFRELYEFDLRVARVADTLQRRAIRLDVDYTRRLNELYGNVHDMNMEYINSCGCSNLNSAKELADTIIALGGNLTKRTPTGKLQVTDAILRELTAHSRSDDTSLTRDKDLLAFIDSTLEAKRCAKRRKSYTESMLREMDDNGRIHPSINILAARTARMSVSNPPLQQLPTKNNE
jgi:DNA polymerase-1